MSGAGADVPAEHVEGSSDAVVDLLAALAYGELTAFMRLAEDAELAPTLPYTAALGRLAVAEFSHFELLRERLVTIGADPELAMQPFVAPVDAFHSRTAVTTKSACPVSSRTRCTSSRVEGST